MVFSSIPFLYLYLPIVLAVYYITPVRWRNSCLFIANFIFYGWGEPIYILLMLLSILVNYISGILIEKNRACDKKARLVLIVNTAANLAILLFFKYFDLIASTISLIPGVYIKPLALSLPIGISFYTFQTMSYPIDLYRGDAKVQRSFVNFSTFVALFPQLIAGPIVRYKDISDQLGSRSHTSERFASGISRFVIGLGKKVLIANNIGMLWDIYSSSSSLTSLGAWTGILAFALQIYFDFSGYSDMAIGLGRMIGFEFLENFDYPYTSRSVTEFWRRWHMSLGTWFRDYVYIPLGGNRRGLPRQIFNIITVWALTGLWHGASWTFLLWGLYYAVFLTLEKVFFLKFLEKLPRFFGRIYTLFVVLCGWVFFEFNTLPAVVNYFRAMFGAGAGLASKSDLYYLASYAAVFIIAAISTTPAGVTLFRKIPEKARGAAVCALVLIGLFISTAYLVDASYNPFLYFKF